MTRAQRISGTCWLTLAVLSLWASGFPQLAAYDPLAFPDDFLSWNRTTSILNEGGYHEVYANENANTANREVGVYPDGAKILVVTYDRRGGTPRQFTLMIKDLQLFSRSVSGWGFARFTSSRKRLDDPTNDQFFSVLLR